MSTRALIIGKYKNGLYHYGQTKYDGMDNLEWLQKNMSDANKVEDFLHYMTEGCEEGGEGHGISSLWYNNNEPYIKWYEDGYNCGISKTKKAILDMVKARHFDFPEYISYWDGKKWKNI